MKVFLINVKRNVKLFFKDKGLFFTSLATPLILLVLYATFLANVYENSFVTEFEKLGVAIPSELLKGMVSGQLVSSLLGVSCVTVAFCSNMLMVQDKVTGARKDMLITPVKRSTLALSYFAASFLSTLIVCLVAMALGLGYVALSGWYLSFVDVLMILVDVIVLTLFGTALSSIINYFLSSQGQISAVGSIVSSAYGFLCGAYMPLSQFSPGLQSVMTFFPGTYGMSLLKNHAIGGVFKEMAGLGVPNGAIEGLKTSIDCNINFLGNSVPVWAMFLVLVGSVLLLLGIYVLINLLSKKKS